MKKSYILNTLIILLTIICIIAIISSVRGMNSTSEESENNILTTVSTNIVDSINTTTGKKGDINGDNIIGLSDTSDLLSYVANLELYYKKPTQDELKVADIDEDNEITYEDAVYILQYYALAGAPTKDLTWEDAVIAARLSANRDEIPSKLSTPEYSKNTESQNNGILGKASVGVKRYNVYSQFSPAPWADKEYWEGTVGENGAGITSLATIISGYGYNVTPDMLISDVPRPEMNAFVKVLEKYGIKSHAGDVNKDDIINNLKSGNAVMINVHNGTIGDKSYVGHYVTLLAIKDDGQILLADSASEENTGWYDQSKIFSDSINGVIYLDSMLNVN